MQEINNDREKLIDAIVKHQNELVDDILLTMPNLVHEKTDERASMLMHALYYRNMLAAELIASKLDEYSLPEVVAMGMEEKVKEYTSESKGINQYAPDGYTPLGIACFFAQYDIARYLIEAGADVNRPANNKYNVAPINTAASTNQKQMVALLLANGADPNHRQESGFTPLHAAAFHGNEDMVLDLLKAGANTNSRNQAGLTPADMARDQGYEALADKL
jgi:ankyrin repeat protein